jgi:serine/threonine protein kinase
MIDSPDPIDQVFWSALQLSSEEERKAYLDRACGNDPELRRRVEKLLRAQPKAADFLERPLAQPPTFVDASEGAGTVIGPYRLLESIGEGGFGMVFLAEQTHPVRRQVALKILKPGMDTHQVVARFETERQALAIMDHPNVAKVFDGGTTPSGRPYFVMELVKGEPITDYCDHNQLTPRQRLELFIAVCQAVQHAHQKGIIHRDLKPSNVLVSSHDTTPVVKVIDFGVAKARGQRLTDKTVFTSLAQLIGTPQYMSPEQAGMNNLDIDTRSDIYSLGVLLYELLTGTTPFPKERLKQAACDEIRRMIREEEPPRPSTRLSESKDALPSIAAQRQTEPAKLTKLLRRELDWIVMRALEKDRSRRYDTAAGFAQDIERYLADEPVLARPPSVGYRLGKFLRGHKGPVAVAGLIALLLVCAGYVLYERTSRLATIAEQVERALSAARTALEAGDLNLARTRAAEAHGHLEAAPGRLPASEAETNRIRQQIETCEAEQSRIDQFLRLAKLAQNRMNQETNREEQNGADAIARQALDFYSFLGPDDWLQQLRRHHMSAAQEEQVRWTAYATLVSLARWSVWGQGEYADAGSVKHGLDILHSADRVHQPTFNFYFVRGYFYEQLGRMEEAEAEYTLLLNKCQAELKADHDITLQTMSKLANACLRLGKLDRAEHLFRQVLDRRRKPIFANYKAIADALAEMGICRLKQKRYLEAESDLRHCLEIREEQSPGHWTTSHAMSLLGEALLGQKRYSEAEPLLLRSCEGIRARHHDIPGLQRRSHLTQALSRLQRLYDAWGKKEEAQRWRDGNGYIRSWLVLSEPLSYPGQMSHPNDQKYRLALEALNQQQIPKEGLLRPRVGGRLELGGKSLSWKEYHHKILYIDFVDLYGRPANHKLTYAVCYLHADTDRSDVALLVGSDDQSKIYLNGQEIYRNDQFRGLRLDDDPVRPLTLRKGRNTLIFKVVNGGGAWQGSIHVIDQDGRPPRGVRFGLEP